MKSKIKNIMLIFNSYYWIMRATLWLWLLPVMIYAQNEIVPAADLIRVIDLRHLPVVIKKPSAMTVSITGDIFITDAGTHLITKLDYQGQYVTHAGGFGWGDLQLDTPMDVATHDGLNLFIADYQNRRIQRYNRHLQYISSLKKIKNTISVRSETDAGYPAALAVSTIGDLFVVNQENNIVMKISASGNLSALFGGFESGRGQLNHPTKIRVTKDKVFLLDDRRIVRYDYFGNYLGDWTHSLLRKPVDFVVDRQERIFIVQPGFSAILIYRSDGLFTGQWLIYDFKDPAAIALMSGRMFVLDRELMLIAVFQISEKF